MTDRQPEASGARTAPASASTEPPTLLAMPTESGKCCKVWCRYCDKLHIHGNGPGHRVAHCVVDDSPYRETGYFLEVVPGDPESLRPPRAERRRPVRVWDGGRVHGWRGG